MTNRMNMTCKKRRKHRIKSVRKRRHNLARRLRTNILFYGLPDNDKYFGLLNDPSLPNK